MNTLVIAEHGEGVLRPSTLHTVAAATQLPGGVDVLVVGHGCAAICAEVAALQGVRRVLCADDAALAHPTAEDLTAQVLSLSQDYEYIVAPGTAFGKNVAPRIAALLDVAPIADVLAIQGPDTFVRPMYAGNVLATVQSSDATKVLTIRTTAFDKVAVGGQAEVQAVAVVRADGKSRFVGQELTQSARPALDAATVVVSGGRGVGSAENFALVEKLADRLGAAVGASRAAVDSGYAPNDYQVGQTGKVVAPQLYVALGISGAIQHLAGMKDSQVIVAINKDAEAPIFQVADYGLVGDLFELVPQLIDALPPR